MEEEPEPEPEPPKERRRKRSRKDQVILFVFLLSLTLWSGIFSFFFLRFFDREPPFLCFLPRARFMVSWDFGSRLRGKGDVPYYFHDTHCHNLPFGKEGDAWLAGASFKKGKCTESPPTFIRGKCRKNRKKTWSTNFKWKVRELYLRTGKVLAPHASITKDDSL